VRPGRHERELYPAAALTAKRTLGAVVNVQHSALALNWAAAEFVSAVQRPTATTRGEAEFIGRLARIYHWRSLVLVTITPQDTRARLRVDRCFSAPVYVVTAPLPWYAWPYEIAYESRIPQLM